MRFVNRNYPFPAVSLRYVCITLRDGQFLTYLTRLLKRLPKPSNDAEDCDKIMVVLF